nr:hypothetical protein [Candidatus Njordarchaeota archaeon]
MSALKRFSDANAEFFYSHFSIIESMWAIARLKRSGSFKDEVFKFGLKSIVDSGRYVRVEETSDVFIMAFELYGLGHNDMVDNILYADSVKMDLRLLTVDDELGTFVKRKGLDNTLIYP